MKIIFFVTQLFCTTFSYKIIKSQVFNKEKIQKIVCSIYLTTKDKIMSQIIFKI